MRIGIIVYSQTGNTLAVAKQLAQYLQGRGHDPVIEEVKVVADSQQDPRNVRLAFTPNPAVYEALVFASPVQGFAMAPAMAAYMAQIPSVEGKVTACFVTHFFPLSGMGGLQALGQMQRSCQAKGGVVRGSGVINWKRGDRDKQITELVERLGSLF
jgi:flavodoxin